MVPLGGCGCYGRAWKCTTDGYRDIRVVPVLCLPRQNVRACDFVDLSQRVFVPSRLIHFCSFRWPMKTDEDNLLKASCEIHVFWCAVVPFSSLLFVVVAGLPAVVLVVVLCSSSHSCTYATALSCRAAWRWWAESPTVAGCCSAGRSRRLLS